MIPLTLSDEQAARVAAETHGIAVASLQRLGSEYASTFRIETANSTPSMPDAAGGDAAPSRFLALKIQGADASTIPVQQWRSEVMHLLTECAHPIPRLLPNRVGSLITFTEIDGHSIAVQLMEWSNGRPYGELTVAPEFGLQLGGSAARMYQDLELCPSPPATISHAWDARHAVTQLTEQLFTLTDPEVRATTFEALALHKRFVLPVQHELPRGLVHQDLHDSNVLADDAGNVTAIIDFDDMLVGWRVAEPAIAAGYLSRRVSDPAAALEAVRTGWCETIPFTPAEEQAFGAIAAIRLALNAAVWSNRLASDRGAYAQERSRGSLAAFRALAECLS